MLFNSVNFLIFFPIVTIIYFLIPRKIKQTWLLLASYFFYMCWNAKYIVLILISTVITYASGILIEKAILSETERQYSRKKLIVFVSFTLNLFILFFFKYFNFAFDCLAGLLKFSGISFNSPRIDIVLPVGISFYTFQALGYTMDVYRGEITAEKNFIKYALFVSFFPQLVAGPIERSKNLLNQLETPQRFEFERVRDGFMLMLWGYFLKIVIADRIAVFVDTVYSDYFTYGGWYIIIATVLFAIQIYCDFSGYSTIAMGTARVLGIQLMENFNAPYLSLSVGEFWRNWHISLTSWFKDYLYIPLGGNKKGKIRKHVNKMIVFLVSGLWHGADLSFIAWGGLNGLYQIIGETLTPIKKGACKFLHTNPSSIGCKVVKMVTTFLLVDLAWIFFRAPNITASLDMIRSVICARNIWILFDGSIFLCGLDAPNFCLMIICVFVLIFADYNKHRGKSIRNIILEQDCWVRWISISFCIIFILIFGKWGPQFDKASFIYFQF